MNTTSALIDYFKKGIVVPDKPVDFALLNQKAVLRGFIIHPDCCNMVVEEWVNSLTLNYNKTFYRAFRDVLAKDRCELFMDQIRHYASTYGTDFTMEGNGYVPNEGADTETPSVKDLKVIEPISEEELCNRCKQVLMSGSALKHETMEAMCEYLFENVLVKNRLTTQSISTLLSAIKNREALCYLSSLAKVLPNDEFGILRCIMHWYTGKTELIKIKNVIGMVAAHAQSTKGSPLLSLQKGQMEKLARIFFRFKPLFLAMKGKEGCAAGKVINKLRRMADKHHTPLKPGFWENIIKTPCSIETVKERLMELNSFRKVRLMMICKEHMSFEVNNGVYTIRNGKQYVRDNYSPKYDKNWLALLYYTLEESLVSDLKKKACKVCLPKEYDLVLPTSEKNFVGNFPYGTSFAMTQHNVIGIYWRNEWGTRDFDLSLTDMTGKHIGWNSCFSNADNAVIYSGDMTNANPEAVEALYCKSTLPDSIVRVNQFCALAEQSKFRLFYANDCEDAKGKINYMVNPNKIRFDTMVNVKRNERQRNIGIIANNRFYLMDMITGNQRVSSSSVSRSMVVIQSVKRKLMSMIPLREILFKAGFEIVEKDSGITPDIDFNNLEKDTLINLLST